MAQRHSAKLVYRNTGILAHYSEKLGEKPPKRGQYKANKTPRRTFLLTGALSKCTIIETPFKALVPHRGKDNVELYGMTQHAVQAYLPHAAIIWGGSEEERFRRALSLAAGRVCSEGTGVPCGVCAHCVKAMKGIHPDILIYDHSAESRLFSVAQVRAIREDAVVMPNEADVKVYILRHADSMNAAAQNAFLKTLEEPPRSAVFFLLADSPENMLPTVVSRCAKICVAPEAAPECGKLAEEFAAALTGGALPLAEFSFRLDRLGRDELRDFIGQARALMLARAQQQSAMAHRFIRAYDALGKALEYLDFNVGVVHVSGFLCAALLDTP